MLCHRHLYRWPILFSVYVQFNFCLTFADIIYTEIKSKEMNTYCSGVVVEVSAWQGDIGVILERCVHHVIGAMAMVEMKLFK